MRETRLHHYILFPKTNDESPSSRGMIGTKNQIESSQETILPNQSRSSKEQLQMDNAGLNTVGGGGHGRWYLCFRA